MRGQGGVLDKLIEGGAGHSTTANREARCWRNVDQPSTPSPSFLTVRGRLCSIELW